MRAIGMVLAVLLAATAAGAAALIVLPAPSKSLALVAIAASERSAFIVTAALLAMALALVSITPDNRRAAALAILLALGASLIGVAPLAQAWRLARDRGVSLDFGRYLRARIDTEGPGQPDRTVTTAADRHLMLDVYLPARGSTAATRPLLVIHGGFWAAGQRGEAALASRRLAELGFTVFDVDYRISPQPNWREAVGDVKCAIGWVKRHATTPDWNVDPAKLALLGRSAGGHLALLAAYTAQEHDLPPSCDAGDTSVESVIALYAPTDLLWGYEHPANLRAADSPAKLRAFLGGPPDLIGDRYRALSPTLRVTSAAPRTLLVQGGRDQLVRPEHLDLLVARLRAAGVAFDTLSIPWAQHAFDFVVGSFSSQLLEAALLEFLPLGPPRP